MYFSIYVNIQNHTFFQVCYNFRVSSTSIRILSDSSTKIAPLHFLSFTQLHIYHVAAATTARANSFSSRLHHRSNSTHPHALSLFPHPVASHAPRSAGSAERDKILNYCVFVVVPHYSYEAC